VILVRYGSPDYGPLVTGYLGMLLMGAACFSIGLFTSSLTQNQVIAAVLSFAILIFLRVADSISSFAGPGMVSDIGTYLSITHHYTDLFNGVVNSTDIIYLLSVVAISLFLATQTLQSRRWR